MEPAPLRARVTLPIPVPGLDNLLGHILPGSILLLESAGDRAASHLAADIAHHGREAGRDIQEFHTRRRPAPKWDDIPIQVRQDLVIDSVSIPALEAPLAGVADRVNRLGAQLDQTGGVAILVAEQDVLDAQRTALLRHLCDGVIRFEARTDGVDVQRIIRIPKWLDGAGRDAAVFYQFDGQRLTVDMRRRHV